ncbi:hypothetical protein BZA70DRAFT_280191 [Myxozyma melibiosi]|uniref:Arrestin-like N-terminal domain-containing protein n=1 Tax=Myxozyma melibiosi TaxID=54550 RepID=A0ABR1F4T1_9ASCO
MRVKLHLDSQTAFAGYPLRGTVELFVDNANSMPTELYVQFKGTSTTASNSSVSNQTFIERHTHANKKVQLYVAPDGPSSSSSAPTDRPTETIDEVPPYEKLTLQPGKNTIRFSIDIPIFSGCPYAPGISDGHRRYQRCGYARVKHTDRGTTTLPLPPSMPPSSRFIVKYGVRAVARRAGIFKMNKSAMKVVRLAPAALLQSSDDEALNDLVTTQLNMLSAKSIRLPDSYFVPGALPKASGFRQLMSFGSKGTMVVGVPVKLSSEIFPHARLPHNVPFSLKLGLSIDVDDMSRIRGIINEFDITSIKVVLKSNTDGTAGGLIMMPEPRTTTLLELKNIGMSLRMLSTSGIPQYQVECEKLKALIIRPEDTPPSFTIKSMKLRHSLRVEVGLTINGSSEKKVDVERNIIVTSGNDYDPDSMAMLPPGYEFNHNHAAGNSDDEGSSGSSDWGDDDIKEDFFAD